MQGDGFISRMCRRDSGRRDRGRRRYISYRPQNGFTDVSHVWVLGEEQFRADTPNLTGSISEIRAGYAQSPAALV